jgi:hypothetical protein
MAEEEYNPNDVNSDYEQFLKLQRKMLNALSPEEREQYDFHLRFRESVEEHREKLDALPPEKRKQLEGKLRENLAANEKEQEAYLDDHDRFSFEGLRAMREKHHAEAKSLIDEAHEAHAGDDKLREQISAKARQESETVEHVDRAQEAWDRMQQERGRDQGQEKEPER